MTIWALAWNGRRYVIRTLEEAQAESLEIVVTSESFDEINELADRLEKQ